MAISSAAGLRPGAIDAGSPSARVLKPVALLLGAAAGAVGLRMPEALASLPSPATLLLLLAIAIACLGAGRERLLGLRVTWFDAIAILLVLVRIGVEVLNASELLHPVHAGTLTGLVLLYGASLVPRLLIRDSRDLRTFLYVFALPSILVAALAVAQMLRIPGVLEWVVANVRADALETRIDNGRTDLRATSTIGHWTALGGYLAIATSLFCHELIANRSAPNRRWRAVSIIAIALLTIGQISTLTFSTAAISGVVLLMTFVRLGAPLWLVGAGGLAAWGGWQVFGAGIEARLEMQSTVSRYTDESLAWLPSTVAYRVRIWEAETLPAIGERFWTGWGQQLYAFPDSWPVFPADIVWLSPESQWLGLLVRGGIVDLLVFVLLLVAMLVALLRARRMSAGAMWPVIAGFLALIGTCLINSPFSTSGVPQLVWVIAGACIAAAMPGAASAASDRRAVLRAPSMGAR